MANLWRITIVFCFASIAFLSSCSTIKRTATSSHPVQKSRETTPADAPDEKESITFIDDINLERSGKPTRHKAEAYSSPVAAAPAKRSLGNAESIRLKYAQILNIDAMDLDNLSLYDFINDWWGAPYRYGGDSRDGIDCSAFTQALYAVVFGLSTIPRTAQEQYNESKKLKKKAPLKEGDLVFFRIRSRHISHVGVYLQNNKFVHASLSSGVTISDLDDPYWKRYFVCGGEPD